MSFESDLEKFEKETMQKFTKVRRMSAFQLFATIVLETPVDKGVLRNNWFAGIGQGSTETTSDADISGSAAISKMKSVVDGANAISDIFLTNNLPYASVIEFGDYPNPAKGGKGLTKGGFSLKAPAGMVRVNTLNWDRIVAANVLKVG